MIGRRVNSPGRSQGGFPAVLPEEPVLRLHLNENPYGCSLLVQESLSISDTLAMQPGSLSRKLQESLSRYSRRPAGELYLADSPLDLLSRVLSVSVGRHGKVLALTPYGSTLRQAATLNDVVIDSLSTDSGPLEVTVRERADGGPATVYLSSPNEVTGTVTSPLEIVALLRGGSTVIADETYAEYTDRHVGVLGGEFPNLISIRSFAPWAGLWGIPVSYAATGAGLVRELDALYPQTRLSAASRIAAGASLDDLAILDNRVKHVRLERARLYRRLRKLNFVQPSNSHGPFITCEVTRGNSDTVCALLEREGVLIHNCRDDGLEDFVRVTVGTSEQTDHLMAAMCRISVEL